MNNKIRWLRISYWAGAIVDAYMALRWLFPETLAGSTSDASYRWGMKWGVALMLGWTCLLIWADRKPLERRDVLLITVCPVIVGLIITAVATFSAGFGSARDMALLIVPAALIVLMMFSYLNARKD